MKPLYIFIDGQELLGYTSFNMTRTKKAMTGEASFEVFMDYMPTEPTFVDFVKGKQLAIYIGGHLAMVGTIDLRRDEGTSSEQPSDEDATVVNTSASMSIEPDSYTVSFTARGKTKLLIDSSHQNPEGTILKPTNKSAMEKLIAPWGVELDWQATEIELDKVRLRSNGRVIDELQRIAMQSSLYLYETRDGKLKVTDAAETITGEDIVLGRNIMQFSTDQFEQPERSDVKVKGKLLAKSKWGADAILPTFKNLNNAVVESFRPETVQMFGEGTPELLERRAQFEQNKRNAEAKEVVVEVFHIQQTTGQPWDIGNLHYVQIPPAGVFDTLEVITLTYTINARNSISTKLTLAPPPVNIAAKPTGFLAGLKEDYGISSVSRTGNVSFEGQRTYLWGSPQLSERPVAGSVAAPAEEFLGGVSDQGSAPPLRLPPSFDQSLSPTLSFGSIGQ